MTVLTHHVTTALTTALTQETPMTEHRNEYDTTADDVAHLTADQDATVEFGRINGEAYPITARTYEHAGALYLASFMLRYADGSPGSWVVRVIDPAPPKPVAPPVMRRSPDGQRYAMHSHDGTRDPWRVMDPSARYSGDWLSDAEVVDWTPMVITAGGEDTASPPPPAPRVVTETEVAAAAGTLRRCAYPLTFDGDFTLDQVRISQARIRAILAELNIEVEES